MVVDRVKNMSESKMVIRINFEKDKHFNTDLEPKTVTAWHIPRILTALSVLILLITLAVFSLDRSSPVNVERQAGNVKAEGQPEMNAGNNPTGNAAFQPDSSKNPGLPQTGQDKENVKRPPAIIFDKKVLRASLNYQIKDNQPYQQVNEAIKMPKNKAIDLFYFTEIKGINGNSLFHYWYKDGVLVYKTQFEPKVNKSRLISSKKLSAGDIGEWQIQLADRKGKVLSEVNFNAEPE